MNNFNQFPDYQCLEENTKGAPAKANRSIPDRIKEYGLLDILNKDSRVLDIGCNRGYFGILLSSHINSYYGIDTDLNQIKHGITEINNRNISNVKIEHKGFELINEKFHLILCFAVHSYIDKSMEVLGKELISMMYNEGYLIIEGHPPTYRGEPEKYYNPLKEYLLTQLFLVEEKTVIDRANKRPLMIFKKINSGMVSECYNINGIIEKRYFPDSGIYKGRGIKEHWNKELFALRTFEKEKHIPKLLGIKDNVMKLEYCGERLTKKNLPKDWQAQCDRINELQKKHKIYHSDIMLKNILVKEGIIYLIDWGLYTNSPNKFNIKQVISEL